MKYKKPPTSKVKQQIDPVLKKEAELLKANKRIEELEKSLANREEELDLLKKARRFFMERKKKSSSS